MTKPYPVSSIPGRPNLDSLPVAKIIHYPLEERDYKPFAQCVLCVGEGALHLRMWAFEVSVPAGSSLAAVLYLYPAAENRALRLSMEHGPEDRVALGAHLLEDGRELPLDAELQRELWNGLGHRPYNGEDLQGVYWGMTLTLPLPLIERMGGGAALAPGDRFRGNFYKTSPEGRFGHQGSYFPADFAGGNPFGRESTGEFRVVSY